jgi:divalent metal cation (Fe/Co/Zn/Cd) transporter
VEAEIRRTAAQVPRVAALEKCFVRKMGFEYYVDIHVEVDGNLTVREGHEIAHHVKETIRRANPRVADVLVHIEPVGAKRE